MQDLAQALDMRAHGLPNRTGWPLGEHGYHAVFGASRLATGKPITTDRVRETIEAKLVSIRERMPSLGDAKLLSVVPVDPYTKRPALRQAMTPFMKKEHAATMNAWFIPPNVPPPKPVGAAGVATFELAPAAKRVKVEPGVPDFVSVAASARDFASVVASPAPPATAKASADSGATWDDFVRKGWNPKFYERVHTGFELCCDAVNLMGEAFVKQAENGGIANEIDCAAAKANLERVKSHLAACTAALDEAFTVVDAAEKMRGVK
jgi:hypothetical protein